MANFFRQLKEVPAYFWQADLPPMDIKIPNDNPSKEIYYTWRELHKIACQKVKDTSLTPYELARWTFWYYNLGYSTNQNSSLRELPKSANYHTKLKTTNDEAIRKRYIDIFDLVSDFDEFQNGIFHRWQNIQVLNLDYRKIFSRFGKNPSNLLYLDPPYIDYSRNRLQANRYYHVEMKNESDHVELLERVLKLKASVAISHYRCPLYDKMLRGWTRIIEIKKKFKKRSEIDAVWVNPSMAIKIEMGKVWAEGIKKDTSPAPF